ncbi:hypothetical protein [Streptomyces radiopugnans]|uniref:Uncharacterized protein n=1 Tax=Streptomyces radiopugnans TaxID=403935 RepID=A0A1H9G7C9_9ACTN|nr:hypothetical protein [Streptomyces radiopugnans]SEQ45989.1 hypothetical protein SAMN05216481_108133 [Streptomyces radiopugnans]
MRFTLRRKQPLEEESGACGKGLGDLGEGIGRISREIAEIRTALAEAAEKPPSQAMSGELHRLRRTASDGIRILQEENQTQLRRQEEILGRLGELRLEITGGRTGAHPPPAPGSPGADEPGGADGTGEAGDGTAGTAGAQSLAHSSAPSDEAPETQDSRRQEERMEQEQDGVPEPPDGAAPSRETEETPEERVRKVKEAAEQALRNRSEDSRGRTDRTATSPVADDRRLHGVHADGTDGQRPGRQDGGRAAPRDPLAEHAELLLNAAGVSRAELVCHRDTWEFLLVQAVRHPRFRVPGEVKDIGDGKVGTHLSGPSLIAALISLWKTREEPSEEVDADWAMAAVLYDRIRDRLTEAGPGDGRRTVRIVLDDGDGPEETAVAAETSAEEEPEAA